MSETPGEIRAEIEKLEGRHEDNPQGRYFVPLANAYRKAGELPRAESLLREGLRHHPDYLSAHIVLGRCLADRGAEAEATEEFRYVLSMDPQNLVALRTLGELALAGGRRDDALHWYEELIAVDPMNEDARGALESLRDSGAEPESPATPEAGDYGFDTDFGEWPATDDPSGVEPAEATDETEEAPTEMAIDAGGDDLQLYGGFLDLGEPADTPEPGDPDAGTRAQHDEPRSEPEAEPEREADAPADEPEGFEGVVTETIAELYARQGLNDRAIAVYRELIRRRGSDAALERRLAELENRPEPDAFAASFEHGFEAGAAAVDERPTGIEAPESEALSTVAEPSHVPANSGSIAAYLTTLAAWRPAEPADAPEWREEGAATGVDELPALAEADVPEPAGESPAPGAEELFPWEVPEPRGAEPHESLEESAPPAADEDPAPGGLLEADPADVAPGEPAPAPEASVAPEGAAEEEDDDLESFQAWLRSLKR